MSLEPTAHAAAPSEEAIQAALVQAEADYAEALAMRSTDMAASMALIQRAAAGGHAEAQSVMGLAHAQGHGGVAADLEKAVHFCRAAALQDHAEATYNLVALCNARPGCLEAQSSEQAIGWLRQAASAAATRLAGCRFDQRPRHRPFSAVP
jgi:TPR repeat protein